MLGACTMDTECRQDMAVEMGMELIGDSIKMNGDTAVHQRFTNGIFTIYGLGRDSLIVDSVRTSRVYAPLRKDADTTGFVMRFEGQQDTLYLAYTRRENFVSLACGCAIMASIDSVWSTHRFIDSLCIKNTNVTTATETHVSVYYHK